MLAEVIEIIPAYAGSTACSATTRPCPADHPRIRGEHIIAGVLISGVLGSSPHTRGAPPTRRRSRMGSRIIPAYAGSTEYPNLVLSPLADHPRIRGEHDFQLVLHVKFTGSSPHTRGARGLRGPRDGGAGIIPAYAGSTPGIPSHSSSTPDHPRIRGEHCPFPKALLPWTGSSPHTRGAPQSRRRLARLRGIIPAYAGSTRPTFPPRCRHRDHPRIRGEHCCALMLFAVFQGSSPHTRGARRLRYGDRTGARIIPAYAGSTRRRASRTSGMRDHPRIRGEHPPPFWPSFR